MQTETRILMNRKIPICKRENNRSWKFKYLTNCRLL